MPDLTNLYGNPTLLAISNANTLGNNTVIAAPGAGKRLLIRSCLVWNAAATPAAIGLRDGGSTITPLVTLAASGVEKFSFPGSEGADEFVALLSENAAFVWNIDTANAGRGIIRYNIVGN